MPQRGPAIVLYRVRSRCRPSGALACALAALWTGTAAAQEPTRAAEEDGAEPSGAAGAAAPIYERSGHFLCKYKPNYFLFGNATPVVREAGAATEAAASLVKFQLSIAYPLWVRDRARYRCDEPERGSWTQVFFGFTQKSLWALWQFDRSSPFLESNYAPELFWYADIDYGPLARGKLGLEHESNGEFDGPRNRSWNRVYLQAELGWGSRDTFELLLYARAWKTFGVDVQNRDITRQLGHGELILVGISPATPLGRFELEAQASWGGVLTGLSWRLSRTGGDGPTSFFYAQYFHGKGEMLLSYDRFAQSVWLGMRLLE